MNDFSIESVITTEEKISSRWRSLFVWFSIMLVIAFIFRNLVDLQIINGEKNLVKARNIYQNEQILRAPRGLIFDKNGIVLAQNVGTYTVFVNPAKTQDIENEITKLASILNKDGVELLAVYQSKYEEFSANEERSLIRLISSLSEDEYYSLILQIDEFDGITVAEDSKRVYKYPLLTSHLIGYVGDINSKEVEITGLDQNTKIGKDGVEKEYDLLLRGVDGTKLQTANLTEAKYREVISEMPASGANVFLTIDIYWQEKLYELIEKRVNDANAFAGVGIIMESNTGKIRAMVNYPSYDNNLFASGISSKDFESLNSDEATPLLNRAIALQLPTGSIFKPIVAATALEEGVVSRSTKFDSGCVELPMYKLCEADNRYLGKMGIVEGLGRSSNVFFCKTGLELAYNAGGINTLAKYANDFGVGQLTQIDLPGEQSGTMATPELKLKLQKEPWYLADICNTVIGQGLVTSTPIQMAVVASTIENQGSVVRPHILEKAVSQEGKQLLSFDREVIREIPVKDENFRIIKDGMYYAINGEMGSANQLKGLEGRPYVKTGSADATEYRNGQKITGAHSWVMGGFEYDNTDYTFLIHLQEGGRGYQSLPVIKDFINWLYKK